MTIKKNSKPPYDNPEAVAQFTFCGVTHRIVIFERNGQWHSHYKRIGEGVIPHGEARSRQELMRGMKSFMIGHGSCLMSNLIEDAERS